MFRGHTWNSSNSMNPLSSTTRRPLLQRCHCHKRLRLRTKKMTVLLKSCCNGGSLGSAKTLFLSMMKTSALSLKMILVTNLRLDLGRKTSSGFSLIRRHVPDEDEDLQRTRFELTKLETQFFDAAKAVDKLAIMRKSEHPFRYFV